MEKAIQDAVDSTTGLYAIMLTDTDGVVILQAMRQALFDGAAVVPMVKSVATRAAEQASKLGFSKQSVFLASYEEAQVALANVEGGMVVVIASVEADPDVLNSLAKELGASVNKIAG